MILWDLLRRSRRSNKSPKSTSPSKYMTLKTTSPNNLLEKLIPKQNSIQNPSKHHTLYVPKQTSASFPLLRLLRSGEFTGQILADPKQNFRHPKQIRISSTPPSTGMATPSKSDRFLGNAIQGWTKQLKKIAIIV